MHASNRLKSSGVTDCAMSSVAVSKVVAISQPIRIIPVTRIAHNKPEAELTGGNRYLFESAARKVKRVQYLEAKSPLAVGRWKTAARTLLLLKRPALKVKRTATRNFVLAIRRLLQFHWPEAPSLKLVPEPAALEVKPISAIIRMATAHHQQSMGRGPGTGPAPALALGPALAAPAPGLLYKDEPAPVSDAVSTTIR